MTVNAVMGEAQAGNFATSRRSTAADDAEFIIAKARAGVPLSQIARMVRRNIEDVRLVAGAFACIAYQDPETVKKVAEPPLPPKAFTPKSRVKSKRTPPLWARVLIRDVAEQYGLTPEDIQASSQKATIAHPRQHVYYALYATGRCSLSMIGSWFNKDHSTILHGIRRHARRFNLPVPEYPRMHIDSRVCANGEYLPEQVAA